MSYLIFARKYRPQTFEDMVGQKSVVQTLQNAIRTKRVTQAYLFSGMRGTGKTTAARILAKALNCVVGPTPTPCNVCEECVAIVEDRSLDVLEIDGASSGGIDQIRTLRESLKYKPIHSRTKVIIIDEVHQVTGPAFQRPPQDLEEPPAGTVFIFATTEFNGSATIISLSALVQEDLPEGIINHLMDISKKENITISPNGLGLIADASDGSMRDAQSLLDQAVAFSGEVVNDEELKEILGSIAADLLYEGSSAVLGEKPEAVFPLVDKLVEGGTDLRVFFKELIGHFRNLLLVRSVDDARDILSLNGPELERLRAEAGKASAEDLIRHLLALQQAGRLRFSSHPRSSGIAPGHLPFPLRRPQTFWPDRGPGGAGGERRIGSFRHPEPAARRTSAPTAAGRSTPRASPGRDPRLRGLNPKPAPPPRPRARASRPERMPCPVPGGRRRKSRPCPPRPGSSFAVSGFDRDRYEGERAFYNPTVRPDESHGEDRLGRRMRRVSASSSRAAGRRSPRRPRRQAKRKTEGRIRPRGPRSCSSWIPEPGRLGCPSETAGRA
jgi:DNA polymerase-3 subunit gamma/tau